MFRLWMLPWMCVLGYCCASFQSSSSEGKLEACKGHTSRDPCPRQEPELKSNKIQSV